MQKIKVMLTMVNGCAKLYFSKNKPMINGDTKHIDMDINRHNSLNKYHLFMYFFINFLLT